MYSCLKKLKPGDLVVQEWKCSTFEVIGDIFVSYGELYVKGMFLSDPETNIFIFSINSIKATKIVKKLKNENPI